MRMVYVRTRWLRTVVSALFLAALCVGGWSVYGSEEPVPAAAERDAELLSRVTRRGDPARDAVSLLFLVDESTDADVLAETRQILADNRVFATFFLTGKFAEAHGDLTRALRKDGHELGICGYEAVSPGNLDYGENLAALEKSCTVLRGITGETPRLYTSPYGELNSDIYEAVKDAGLTFVLAEVDARDWEDSSTEAIVSTALTEAGKGSFINLRSTSLTNLGLQTIFNELRGLRLDFLTVSANCGD